MGEKRGDIQELPHRRTQVPNAWNGLWNFFRAFELWSVSVSVHQRDGMVADQEQDIM